MTMQDCPNCGKRGFTLYIDDEVAPDTYWTCDSCDYFATEDESLVTDCPECLAEQMTSVLDDKSNVYRYCFKCKKRVAV